MPITEACSSLLNAASVADSAVAVTLTDTVPADRPVLQTVQWL
jgi:hypothetical protein